MDMQTILGYLAMMSLGISLGFIGAGGSILTVPILVYLLAIPPTQATGYSLVIVGATALVGGLEYLRRGQSNPRMAVIFGVPAIVGVYLTRRYIFPAIPDPVFQINDFVLGKDLMVMVLFAIFMLITSIAMIRSKKEEAGHEHAPAPPVRMNYPVIFALGLGVGIITGFVGAGGGFMILPVLVLFGGLPMKVAIGTDLLIIGVKSLIGFLGEMQVSNTIDFGFVGVVTILPLIGIAIGTYLNKLAPAGKLKIAFGWFVLVMGIYIVSRELLFA